MEVKVLTEHGHAEALLGLSLSYNQPVENMLDVAKKLAGKDSGHNKFLESVAVWLCIRAPRYWWQQFDTYRVGVTKQSESTMHTLKKGILTEDDFERITIASLEAINWHILNSELELAKALLPEGFLQTRVVCTNYKALRHMYHQRKNHKLAEWHLFIREILNQLEHPKYITA